MSAADRSVHAVRVDVLGPLALHVDGRPVDVPGPQRRALLAVLALGAGRLVGTDRLVDALWPDDPPVNADQALYNHVSRLRGHLKPYAERLQRRGGGYVLDLLTDELDVDEARRLAAADRPREALALWRAPALEEFRAIAGLEAEAVGLDELRVRLADDLLEARLRTGDLAVAADAAAAVVADPLRERTVLLLVRALATEGRTAEAMDAAREYRARLADETGLDPGAALAELEQQVAAGITGPTVRHVVGRPDGPLVGRQQDREAVLRLLGSHAAVTIAGPGGVGKTRLALDVAAEVSATTASDVVVADLAAVDRPDRLCQAVASTLGLRVAGTVRAADVAAALAGRDLLLVLDNCEHLPDACRDLVSTVRRLAPGVRVLATSRVTLHVPGEYVLRIQPLPVPRSAADLGALRRQPAVRAFVEHVRRRRPGFELEPEDAADVVEVLRALDGLPLGIELAARQVSLMPLRAVRERLDRALDLATGRGGPDDDRQRTLRATIGSSYQLLGDDERALLRALAPFPGGVDLATVETLAPGGLDPVDLLHRLVDSSLVVAEPRSGRFRLLFTVRAFLLDELRSLGETTAAEARFLERCVAVAEAVAAASIGPDEDLADRMLRAEIDNLRAAWDLAPAHGDLRVPLVLALADAALWRDLREIWSWALELAADPSLRDDPRRAAVLGFAAASARLLGDLDLAASLAEQSLDAAGPDPDPVLVHRAWAEQGCVAHFRGGFDLARERWFRAAAARPQTAGVWLTSAALATSYGGDVAAARLLLDRSHQCNQETRSVSHAAYTAYVEGELRVTAAPEQSIPHYLEAIDAARRCGAWFVDGVANVALASARARAGDVVGAAGTFGYLLDSWRRSGHTTQLWTTARNAAALLAATGHTRTAALLLISADEQPGAATVSPAIARHSGRLFVPLEDIVEPSEIADLRAEAEQLTPTGVLDLARADLAALA
ncbi:BTAD domain-containing putative transcriptional regulator [Nocardioides sp. SR21]|uniref:BTAD domain-containing putative transcriptional regulator n=1 Tax=Nocardioides sp. SR21 TaxID=2919501 RepID=UPI001FA95B64|nr:BTAD domain-containing putative transcriptional regulator [Nocardioides sp. SR21]